MSGFLLSAYPWLKALHIVAVISWMAGLLYLPRLFVYHCRAEPGSQMSETFKTMERLLLRAIMTPAMVVTYLAGFAMLAVPGYLASASGWLVAKLLLVVGLTVVHWFDTRWRRDFELDRNEHPDRFFRFMNEVPTLIMIGIVILVVVKPF